MVNLTLSVDEKVLWEAKKIALAKGTSVNSLVRDYLDRLGETRLKREESVRALESIWKRSRAHVGRKTWTRDDLHGR